jgi:hypothetical protein
VQVRGCSSFPCGTTCTNSVNSLNAVRKITKSLTHESEHRAPQDPGPSEFEVGVLKSQFRRPLFSLSFAKYKKQH